MTSIDVSMVSQCDTYLISVQLVSQYCSDFGSFLTSLILRRSLSLIIRPLPRDAVHRLIFRTPITFTFYSSLMHQFTYNVSMNKHILLKQCSILFLFQNSSCFLYSPYIPILSCNFTLIILLHIQKPRFSFPHSL